MPSSSTAMTATTSHWGDQSPMPVQLVLVPGGCHLTLLIPTPIIQNFPSKCRSFPRQSLYWQSVLPSATTYEKQENALCEKIGQHHSYTLPSGRNSKDRRNSSEQVNEPLPLLFWGIFILKEDLRSMQLSAQSDIVASTAKSWSKRGWGYPRSTLYPCPPSLYPRYTNT